MLVVMAQGECFYGVAFFTTDVDFAEARRRLAEAGLDPQRGSASCGSAVVPVVPGDMLYVQADDKNRTTAYIMPFAGRAQPEPVVLFDSGNATNDLELLARIKAALA